MPAELSTDWRGAEILLRRSRGISGVPYVEDWRRNVIGNTRDAPPFLMRQVRAYVAHSRWFTDEDAAALSADLGRISMVQSLRSGDAITWSWFGTLAAADLRRRASALRW